MKPKTAKEPLYRQIKAHLSALIEQNIHNTKYRLPSENQLASQFGTSRIPVIQAMRELEEEGKILRVQGSGSFINVAEGEQNTPQMRFAVLLPQIKSQFCNAIVDGIRTFLNEKGIMLHICVNGDDPELEKAYIDSIRSMHFHGLFLFPVLRSTYSNTILKLAISKFPVVFIGRNMPHLDVSSILCDPFDQIFRAVEFLHKEGHKKVIFISENSTDDHFYKKRCQGFRSAIQFFYQNSEPRLVEIDFFCDEEKKSAEISEKIIAFLNENADADAILTSDLACYTVAKHLCDIGNTDKTIMVLDNTERIEQLWPSRLLALDQNPEQIGYTAAEQLYSQVAENAPIKSILIPERYIEKS